MTFDEHLMKAEHSLGFLCDDLKAAHAHAKPVCELILSDHLEAATNLRNAIRRLRAALEAENNV